MNLAESYVQNTLKFNLTGMKQRIAVLPAEVNRLCPWSGARAYEWAWLVIQR